MRSRLPQGVIVIALGMAICAAGMAMEKGENKMGLGSDADGRFFREHWAERDQQRNNCRGRLLRVNDPAMSLDARYGTRFEARTNGLLLIDVPVDLFALQSAELYLELWGGHPSTAKKRFALNGRGEYALPEVGTADGACTYSYPSVPLAVGDLVQGTNAFQFRCERGEGFWGHFIIDNAWVRTYLAGEHADLEVNRLSGFSAVIRAPACLEDEAQLTLDCPAGSEALVESVHFYARYRGFDEDGDGDEADWHGFTQAREPTWHVGTAREAPFGVTWDTRMVPTQDAPLALMAVVCFRNGLRYATPICNGLRFPEDRPGVRLFSCAEMPQPFWSRAGREKVAAIDLPHNLTRVERADLLIKVWDGGGGEVEHPFTINGHPYSILSGRSVHDVVPTRCQVDLGHLLPGRNEFRLLSDTEHHGVEVLLPGPCLILREAE